MLLRKIGKFLQDKWRHIREHVRDSNVGSNAGYPDFNGFTLISFTPPGNFQDYKWVHLSRCPLFDRQASTHQNISPNFAKWPAGGGPRR